MTRDLLDRLRNLEAQLPLIGVILCSHVGKSREEAFGELAIGLASEVVNLKSALEFKMNSEHVHPLSQGPLHYYSGGTVIITPPATGTVTLPADR